MKYALLIYSAPEELAQHDDTVLKEYMEVAQSPGVVGGERLHPAEAATTVRVQDSRTLTTDGPFADTKEVLGGFFLFEADDIDAALDVAARIPAARLGGAVEVRPIWEM
jgi:hypothetical protein